MHKVLTVTWREFKHTVFTPAFLFGAIGVPLLVIGVMVLIPIFFRPNVTPLEGTIAIVDEDGFVTAAAQFEFSKARMEERVRDVQRSISDEAGFEELTEVASQLTQPNVNISIERVDETVNIQSLKDRVLRGELIALVAYPATLASSENDPVDSSKVAIYAQKDLSPNHGRLIRRAMRDAVVRARVDKAGQDFDEVSSLLNRPATELRTVTADGEKPSLGEEAMLIPMAFMMLIWIATFSSANYLLTTTIEEKSNKVIEVLLSAVSPMQLMTGKIIGQGMVSLVMLLTYGGVGIASLVFFSFMHLVPPMHLVYLCLYFVMAFFMIASMMAGIGSAVNELREAQSLVTPAMLILMIPLILWLPIQESPNGILATTTSFIPPLIPFVMILRITSPTEQVVLWQVFASLIWGYAAMIGFVWMAAKVFRVGLLMYGKPPSPLELIKWIRYS